MTNPTTAALALVCLASLVLAVVVWWLSLGRRKR
jgi:hypothetical protein